MGNHRAVDTGEATTEKESGPKAAGQSQGTGRYPVRVEDGHPVGRPAARNGVWVWDDVLAAPERMGTGRGMAETPRSVAGAAPGCRADRLVTRGGGQFIGASVKRGEETGPNPTDRAKSGSKHHTITDAQGIPLAVRLSAANANDITQLLPVVDAIPPIRGQVGRPRRRPRQLYADRGYDSNAHRQALRDRSITPQIARRSTRRGSGLGLYRWVVERTLSWLHQFRRLRIRFERYACIHRAFLSLACSLICWRFLKHSFC